MPVDVDRRQYALVHGPTAGDRIRLGDTTLVARIEHDHARYGDEVVQGWAKTMRNGMMLAGEAPSESQLDVIIVGAVVIDPVLGIFKGSIGIKDGRIVGIGNAGNPDIADAVDLVIGPGTTVIPGAGLIATPGGVDSHVHFVTPRLMPAALDAGVTTVIGGGLNHNPAANLQVVLAGMEAFPVNVGLQARASTHKGDALRHLAAGGGCGFKVHEDYGAYPVVIDAALRMADDLDVSVCLHTDGLNEAVEIDETIAAIGDRTIHAYHVEGAGGGHNPDALGLVTVPNVIPSSTTPTLPYGVGAEAEHLDMTIVCHGLNAGLPEDVEAVRRRVRHCSMAAEDLLHDLGAISIINSDSQGMGRIQETIRRTWQLADVNKRRAAARGEDLGEDDNDRILRYVAKYTINPARTHGMATHVGSLEPGKMADIVLWDPRFFGAKPEQVIKAGTVAWQPMGDGNATVRNSQPVTYGAMWGGAGRAPERLSAFFMSQAALEAGVPAELGTRRAAYAVSACRGLTKADLVRNAASPPIDIDPRSGRVYLHGDELTCEPVTELPLNRSYFLT